MNIPTNLQEAIKELDNLLIDEDKNRIINNSEKETVLYHHSLGRWIRNNWKLWGESDLKSWFNDRGIEHADDMSGIILTSYWRSKNDKPINLGIQIEFYKNYWEKANKLT